MTTKTDSQIVDHAITTRRSVRSFLPATVPQSEVATILEAAARAPSGTNMQPWRVYVTTGDAKERLSQAVLRAHNDQAFRRAQVYDYYPHEFFEPYLSRRRKVGWDLYNLLGIEKGDKEKMHNQHGRNYVFFGAPVGMIFTIDRRLEIGSWLDYGMFLENIMIAARGRGMDTCPQAAFAPFQEIIRPELDIPETEVVVCGMALGYADEHAVENTLKTERAPLEEFATFRE